MDSTVTTVLVIVAGIVPAALAVARKPKFYGGISMLNIGALVSAFYSPGLAVALWLAALVWALIARPAKRCRSCASVIDASAQVCPKGHGNPAETLAARAGFAP